MIRAWIGVALLAVSWLLGLGYYYPANYLAWAIVVVLGVVCLSDSAGRGPRPRDAWTALLLLAPAVWFTPWPHRAAPLLIVLGLAVELLPIPRRWAKALGRGAVAAGVILLVQALIMAFYAGCVARSHELPWPLPDVLAGVAGLLGIEAVADGSTIVMHSIRQVHYFGATWELLLDPPTLCFFVGSLVMCGLVARARLPAGGRWSAWIGALRTLTLVLVVWLPIRAGLLLTLYLHRVLRSDPDMSLHVMNLFLSPWILLLLLLGPVLLAWRFVRLPTDTTIKADHGKDRLAVAGRAATEHEPLSTKTAKPWHFSAAAGLLLLAVAIFTVAVEWDPVGTRQAGRVMIVERHSTWEPTTRPYDTKWFGHDSGYNYAAAYDYCAQYFEMSRLLETDKIDDETLGRCDVLVIKIPTLENAREQPKDPARYSKDEVAAVLRFVERGGGLLLIGDHTNVFNCGTYLNDIARPMGFTFRHDLLFGTGKSPYEQLYRAPLVPHPVVQHLPPMDFAVSCSIDPGRGHGRTVIRGTGLWSLPPDYHLLNYHTVPQHRPDMRYGAFIQLWSTRYGKGRVLAFTDSTIFSNFCAFQPGKAELLLGMLEWLNHRGFGDPRLWLVLLGLLPFAAGLWLGRTRLPIGGTCSACPSEWAGWLVLLAAGLLGWVLASGAVAAVHRWSMPVPKLLSKDRRMVRVVIDRTTSEVVFSNGAFIRGKGEGYGLFEQWISRVDTPDGKLYSTRRSGPEAFSGDALVVISPNRSVTREFRRRLIQYVARGGRLLVLDTPENTASTANSLLWPFGLSVHHDATASGALILGPHTTSRLAPASTPGRSSWPDLEVQQACEVTGGRPLAQVDGKAVGAMAHYKKGTVMAVGFGSMFNDANMGYVGETAIWTVKPNARMLFTYDPYLHYNLQFALLRALVTAQPVAAFYSGHVVIDRTVSKVGLPEPDSTEYPSEGFGRFEHWIDRQGYSTGRGRGPDALSGDLLVVLYPTGTVSDKFRGRVAQYVTGGGKLLLVDSPENKSSTANELLKPFGLSIDHDRVQSGKLLVDQTGSRRWPETTIEPAYRVHGGKPFARLGRTPVGATVQHGKGAVTAIGFGSLFDNASMLGSWDLPAPAKSLVPYDLETAVIRALMTDQSVARAMPSVPDE